MDLESPLMLGVGPGRAVVASPTSPPRIAFAANKRWRVVTLDGKLIETSGTMSGASALLLLSHVILVRGVSSRIHHVER